MGPQEKSDKRKKPRRTPFPGKNRSWIFCLLCGLGFQFVLALPAGIIQAFRITGENIAVYVLLPLCAAPFNMGGLTVRRIYEALVDPFESWIGPRTDTVMSQLNLYMPILVMQAGLLAVLFALRFRRRRTFKDGWIIGVGLFILANSLINVNWPWWGT